MNSSKNKDSKFLVQLHPTQEDILLDQLIDIDSPKYNVVLAVTLEGYLDKEKLKEAVSIVVQGSDILRASLYWEAETPMWRVTDTLHAITVNDIDFSQEDNPTEHASAWILAKKNQVFNIHEDQLFYFALLKLSSGTSIWYSMFHHLVMDGYSNWLFIKQVGYVYSSLISNKVISYQPQNYFDQIYSAREYINSEQYSQDKKYWLSKHKDFPDNSGINPVNLEKQKSIDISFSTVQEKELNYLCRALNVSLQHLSAAALTILWCRTNQVNKLNIAKPIHNRTTSELKAIIGNFVGILVNQCIYDPTENIADLVKRIAEEQRADFIHSRYPASHLHRELKTVTRNRSTIYDFTINYLVSNQEISFKNLVLNTVNVSSDLGRTSLKWRKYNPADSLTLNFSYQSGLFTDAEADIFLKRFLYILFSLKDNLDKKAHELPLVRPEENEILKGFHAAPKVAFPSLTVLELFRQQVAQRPDQHALVSESLQLTYHQLDTLSTRLAQHLQQRGVGFQSLVPVLLP